MPPPRSTIPGNAFAEEKLKLKCESAESAKARVEYHDFLKGKDKGVGSDDGKDVPKAPAAITVNLPTTTPPRIGTAAAAANNNNNSNTSVSTTASSSNTAFSPLRRLPYIKPATPLVPVPGLTFPKGRSVTDSVVPRPLNVAGKVSAIVQAERAEEERKKKGKQKQQEEEKAVSEEKIDNSREQAAGDNVALGSSPTLPADDHGLEISRTRGAHEQDQVQPQQPQISPGIPDSFTIPTPALPYRASDGIVNTTSSMTLVQDTRKINSTPATSSTSRLPKLRVHSPSTTPASSIGGGGGAGSEFSGATPEGVHDTALGMYAAEKPDAIVLGDESMSPTKGGSVARLATTTVEAAARRVSSMTGLVGMVEELERGGGGVSPTSVYPEGSEDLDHGPPVPPKPTFRYALEGGANRKHHTGHTRSTVSDGPSASSAGLGINMPGPISPAYTNPSLGGQYYQPMPHFINPGPSRFSDPVPLPPGFREGLTPEQNLFNLIMGLHHHLDHESGSLGHSLNTKHDVTIDHLIRKHEATLGVTGKWIGELERQVAGLEARQPHIAEQAVRGELEATNKKNQEEVQGMLKTYQMQHAAMIDQVTLKSDQILTRVDVLFKRFDELDARVEMGRCRCVEMGGNSSGGVVPRATSNNPPLSPTAVGPGFTGRDTFAAALAGPRREGPVPQSDVHPAFRNYHPHVGVSPAQSPSRGPPGPQMQHGRGHQQQHTNRWYHQATYHGNGGHEGAGRGGGQSHR